MAITSCNPVSAVMTRVEQSEKDGQFETAKRALTLPTLVPPYDRNPEGRKKCDDLESQIDQALQEFAGGHFWLGSDQFVPSELERFVEKKQSGARRYDIRLQMSYFREFCPKRVESYERFVQKIDAAYSEYVELPGTAQATVNELNAPLSRPGKPFSISIPVGPLPSQTLVFTGTAALLVAGAVMLVLSPGGI